MKRGLFIFCVSAALSVAAQAATITVTSPNAGDFLGRNNNVRFNITGSNREVTVVVTATSQADPNTQIRVERDFTPDTDGKVTGTIPLNFAESTPQGIYNIRVVATEPSNSYNTVPDIPVTVDVRDPKIVDFNPISGVFVSGVVPIRATLEEANIKEWRVRVNGADISNNSGTTADVEVLWDTSSILTDGSQSIELRVEDEATNSLTRTASVTLDRLPPSAGILAPVNGATHRPGSSLAVVVSIQEQFANAIDRTGVDVIILTTDNRFVTRVSRRSVRTDGSRLTWTGRIRSTRNLPSEFKVVVVTVDKAGNMGQRKEVTVGSDNRTRSRTDTGSAYERSKRRRSRR